MNGQEFLDKMGLIAPEYIEDAEEKLLKKNTWVKWCVLAACFCILIGGVIFMRVATVNEAVDQPNDTAADMERNEQDTIIEVENPDTQVNDELNTEKLENQNDPQEEEDDEGIYIPPLELPESNTATMDMIGVVVYKGGIYTQSYTFYDEEFEKIKPLIGDYLGYATGSLNEWSKQDDYAQEFASNKWGDVYTVKGYDSDFRICVIGQYATDESGTIEIYSYVQFLDRLNGITLSNGEDLFEDRLHIRERTEKIQWQSHEDWNWAKGNLHAAPFEDDAWSDFLDEVYQGEFVNTWMKDEAFYEDKPYSSIYDTPNQVHLYLNMNDGTTVELRLIEGGYVGLQTMGWYFVKIPGEAFDAIYEACEGTHIDDWVVAR